MKVTAALILCAITLARGQEVELNENGCPIDYRHELLYAHEICNKFYQCTHGELVVHTCAGDLLFNVDKQECDWPHDTDCGHRVIPGPESEENVKEVSTEDKASQESEEDNNGDNGGDNNGNGDNNTTCNCNPDEAPAICAGSDSEGKLVAHENCNQFYKCTDGVPVAVSCYGDLLYNPYTEVCDWPHDVDCGERVIPDCNDNNGDNGSEENNNEDNSSGDNGNGNGDNNTTCNCDPGEAPSICAGSESEGVLIAHENCNQFYKCSQGVPVVISCYGDLLYNPYTEQCDWPSNVECGDRVVPECDDDNNNNSNGDNDSGGNNNGENGSGDNNNGENGSGGDNNNGGNGDGDNGNGNGTGSCNCNPGEAPSTCAGSGSEGVLIAHENCNQFYKCSHGVPVAMSCYGNLLYNPYTEQCDWPSNVECGDRLIPDCDDENNNNGDNNSNGDNASGGNNNGENGSGDNNNGENGSGGDNNNGGNGDGDNGNGNGTGSCNCNPGEAPSICAGSGSEGVLIAHENCNQFYKCSHGVPVAMSCYGDLLYNPYTEQCDWPSNVECGDRVIPECDGDNGTGDNNNGESGSEDNNNGENGSDGDNNTGGNGDGDNGNGDGTGSCNCNPGEAPSICAGSGSEGTLIAHENCNQFYICSHGVPVTMSCFGDLLYNPYTERCDWPSNVECGDRLIPECDDDNNNNGDNNSNGDNASGGNNNGENGSGDNGNGSGDNGNGNGTGSCNCNPGEAPSICAGSGSEGILIAHENCNQFYKCSHGVPVAMSCYGDLLYNPYTEQCDWPSNVECGDRVIPECDGDNGTGDNNNGESGSGDNNNGENGSDGDNNTGGNGDGDNGNGNETGSCNCNPGEAPSICAGSGSEGTLIAHENCNQFYICSHGVPVTMSCFGDLLYNPYTERCDWPSNVECGDRLIPECDDDNNNNGDNNSNGDNASGGNNNGENGSGDNGNGSGDNGNGNGTGSCNCNPGEAPSICAGSGSEGVLIAHENCNQFYKCSHGVPVAMSCYRDLLYNPYTEQCDWPSNVECGDRVIPECDRDNGTGDNNNGESGSGDNNNGENGSDGDNNTGGNGDGDNGNGNGTGSCNCNPGEAPSICAGSRSEGTLIAHENCNQFYICSHGVPVTMSCFGDLLYNPYTERCDWPSNVECGDRLIPECDDDNNNNGDNNSNGDNASGGNNNGENGSGDNGNGSGDNGNGNGTGSCNCNPGEAPSICAGSGSEGILIAHENCNQFYKCSHGVPVAMSCYGDLLYNPYTEQCDWPSNVECGDRVIPECDRDNGTGDNNNGESGSGDNNNGENGSDGDNNTGGNGDGDNGNGNGTGSCNCNPGEAPSICAGSRSEGTLIAHENCNQFYICSHGVPVTMSCFGDLLYNPYTERCDWPSNVECGDRLIPECDDDNNNNGDNNSNGDNASGGNNNGENGSGDNNNGENGSGGDNNNGGNGDGDNGNGNGTGSCNCNPGEAPSICAGSGSEGVLIAHENCNQFYKCSHGVPVAMSCYGDLLYNPYTEQCDWPSNVECGDRVIPECDGDNGTGDNNNGESGSGDNNNGENGSDGDNNTGGNGDGDNGNGNGTGSCNCNPGEAPSICAGSGSEGTLIAHENCNQFYICSHGVPVTMSCFGDLLYNPYTERCDWPSNVECGDRVVPECDDDNNNNGDNNSNEDNASGGNNNGENGSGDNNNGENGSGGDNNNGGNGDGDNGNGNGTGSCNCNPGEAPSICAGSGSEGVLIAHENCNQFYKCSHGVPVAMSCYGDLLYNPYTEQCDWPSNVECGDRVIPECDGDNGTGDNNNGESGSGDNNNGENGSDGDNNTGGNGDGDNGNGNGTGSCNCNPGEAPSICAGSGSEGTLIAHEKCNQFYICSHGVPVTMSCFGDLLYNPYTERCDWPSNVECGDRLIPECDDDNNNNGDNNSNGDNASGGNNNGENGSGDNNNGENGSGGDNNNGGNGDGDNGNGNGTGSCNCNPGEAPSICAGSGSEGVLIAHENCNQFYKCSHGVPVAMSCYGDLLYNPYTEQCDWPSNVECGDRVIPECDGDNNNNGDNVTGGNNNGESGSEDNNNGENGSDGDNNTGGNGDGDNGNGNGTGSCNCNPGEAPSICAGSGSEGTLIAHENCNQFYICSHRVPVTMSCFGDLLYNPYTERCDWPSNVECGDRLIPECDDDNNNNGDNNSNGDNASGGNNNGENGSEDNNNGENGSGGENNNGGNGDGDNGNGNGTGSCNCNPGEAPSICAGSGSEGVLIAHENCNQFYKCANGIPVALSCYGDLLYNPYTEQCDWPSNVDCGDRVVPECDDDNNDSGDDTSGGNNNGGSGSEDNNNGENGGDSNNDGNSNENSSCNCNPAEAPAICAGSVSEGMLIAHENCNQFYKCSNGVPVALICYGDLLYNPYTEQCDWPDKVECGGRVIPVDIEDNKDENENEENNDNAEENCDGVDVPEVCKSEGSDGLFVAHENCNQFYVCSDKQATILDCPGVLLYDVVSHRCEWPILVDCGDRNIIETEDNGNNNGGCNCNPLQAPVLCAHEDSDGELIAHENCDQFYMCSNGIPVTFNCTATLLYNPYKQVCDWPQNVDCNGRSLSYFTSMNKHLNGRKFQTSKA